MTRAKLEVGGFAIVKADGLPVKLTGKLDGAWQTDCLCDFTGRELRPVSEAQYLSACEAYDQGIIPADLF